MAAVRGLVQRIVALVVGGAQVHPLAAQPLAGLHHAGQGGEVVRQALPPVAVVQAGTVCQQPLTGWHVTTPGCQLQRRRLIPRLDIHGLLVLLDQPAHHLQVPVPRAPVQGTPPGLLVREARGRAVLDQRPARLEVPRTGGPVQA
eukprot:CAMPEP_0175395310 /NCGR_PEP_ID=MMETSP0095-20121207/33883_1 /TAXON_ID=311494 /ORGANISM="Alexandrium monilatum, Strain CCMP3105" /LENGTH=144 /DNA_ID=CAMNT_0016693937 /DNA_START=184 /DNA_END=618 /DNA_ORIENTATION=+